MEVMLKESIPKLGSRGDVVRVTPGYARNYLLPRGLAVAVKSLDARQLELEKKRLQKEETLRLASLQELAEKLKTVSCTITQKATEEGHLFGSVTANTILEGLAKLGVTLQEKNLALEEPIKELGVYTIPVKLEGDLTSEFKLWVVGE